MGGKVIALWWAPGMDRPCARVVTPKSNEPLPRRRDLLDRCRVGLKPTELALAVWQEVSVDVLAVSLDCDELAFRCHWQFSGHLASVMRAPAVTLHVESVQNWVVRWVAVELGMLSGFNQEGASDA